MSAYTDLIKYLDGYKLAGRTLTAGHILVEYAGSQPDDPDRDVWNLILLVPRGHPDAQQTECRKLYRLLHDSERYSVQSLVITITEGNDAVRAEFEVYDGKPTVS